MLNRLSNYLHMMREFRDSAGHLPVHRQLIEMLLIYLMRRIGPGYYLEGRFGHPDIPLSDKLQYFNSPAYVKRVYELNDPLFRKTSQHKIIEAALLNFFAVPRPRSFGHFNVETGLCRDGFPLRTSNDLIELLERNQITRFAMKPCEGYEGRGFVAAERVDRDRLRPLDRKDAMTCGDFTNSLLVNPAGYLVQEYFEQHPGLAELNPTSVNTIRIMVYRPVSKLPIPFGAFLRMGRLGSLVDNGALGGIFANTDMETGVVGHGYFFRPSLETFDVHPDTGAVINGKQLPYWDEAKELASRALFAFPNLRFVGLDIAFGRDGPVLIELNVQPDYGDFAVLRIPSRLALHDEYYEKLP